MGLLDVTSNVGDCRTEEPQIALACQLERIEDADWRLSQQQRRWMLASLSLFACLTLLLIAVLNPPVHSDGIRAINVFFSASYVVLAVWVGCGMMLTAQSVRTLSQSGLTNAMSANR